MFALLRPVLEKVNPMHAVLYSRWFIYGMLYAISAVFLTVLLYVFIYKLQKLYKRADNELLAGNDD